jgi:putative transposase
MRINAIRGVSRRRNFVVTTRRDQRQRPAPDLVKREFVADGPNQLWVADMTYVPTWAGFVFLAVVLDVWSRRIVGWAIGEQMTAELVLAALNMALQQRRPEGVIHHSDQGSTPASPSANGARRWACDRRWAPSAMPTTTRWPRASSPPSSAS